MKVFESSAVVPDESFGGGFQDLVDSWCEHVSHQRRFQVWVTTQGRCAFSFSRRFRYCQAQYRTRN